MNLHLGCGKRFIPGFVHIDAVAFPHVDYVQSIDRLDNFSDNTVDLIYVCHVLEHFKRNQVESVLREWLRVLRPGGILRVSVPDFSALASLYVQTGRLDLVVGPVCGRQDHQYNFHYNIFDFPTIKILFESVGFINVSTYDWRETEHCDVDDFSQAYIPHMDKENGVLISLNVEGVKA